MKLLQTLVIEGRNQFHQILLLVRLRDFLKLLLDSQAEVLLSLVIVKFLGGLKDKLFHELSIGLLKRLVVLLEEREKNVRNRDFVANFVLVP